MDKKILGYWVATGLFCLAMLPGAVMDLIRAPQVMATSYMLRPASRR
jgi:hypothetical protein